MASRFIHLHTHSHYSLLDGLAKIPALVNRAVELGMPALALTEHGNMYSAIKFYKECKAKNIKPIIGVEVYVATESLYQKRPNIDNKRFHLLLLAENEVGYKNLIQLVTISHLDGFYYKPRVDKELLKRHSHGLIALTACVAGEVPRKLGRNDIEEAEHAALEYQEIFGKGNFFLELGHHPNIENHIQIQERLIALGKKLGIPVAATQDVHYLNKEDFRAQSYLRAIQQNEKNDEETPSKKNKMADDDFSFVPGEEMEKFFKDTPEAIENTALIAERCNLELELGKWVFPKIDLPEGSTAETELIKLAEEGYTRKFTKETETAETRKRMEYELDVICKKGYAPYFLVVADIMRYAREKKIINNTRGSAAGSFVSFLAGISSVDPIKYDLPFERFLNPFRTSAPDIDMDFADDRREEIIEYVKQKYGADRVAQIGTFGTIMARAAVRDIARVLGKPYSVGDRLSKMIPMGSQGFPMSIATAIKMAPELARAYEEEAETKEIIDLAQKIEGSARHVSVHAAGVVIAPTKLTDFVPLQYEPKGNKIITQYDMHAVDDAGLLKMDFLGIKNLAILGNSVRITRKTKNIEVDLDNLPIDDKKTFELLAKGETIGLFQLSGGGMTRWLKELRPTNINDIMTMIALFRPGPMANIPTYINRKHKKEKVTYLDSRLEKIIGKTFGVITYQDDVMLIAIELAGYDWSTVDKFRKAMGKKIPAEMAKLEKVFVEGCQKYGGLPPEKAETLWKLLDPFKGYGFGRAHAASYGIVAYQTAYMKANFPAEFMTAVMTSDSGDTEKIAATVSECKQMKISVLPPNVNESLGDFTVITLDNGKEGIRFGLYTIKNLGTEIADAIINERKENGPYKSIADFLDRIQHKNLNKKSLESLTKAGAMDALVERNQLLVNMEDALEYNKETIRARKNQNSLFSLMSDSSSIPNLKLKEAPTASQADKLMWEKELLGLYISGHPLDKFKEKMDKISTKIGAAKKMMNNIPVVTIGMIEEAKKIMTKKNEPMLFVKISDYTDSMEVVVFPRTLEKYGDIIREGNCVAIQGKISLRNGEPSIILDEIKELKN